MLEQLNKIERALKYAIEQVDWNYGKRAYHQDCFIYLDALDEVKDLKKSFENGK